MDWKFAGSKPVYQQIMEHFRAAVLAGEYPPGGRVPSVRELASEARVNPNTVQRALTELEREGLLTGSGTAGRCVTENEETLEALRQQAVERVVRTYAQRMRELGLDMQQAARLLLEQEEE
jgi:DNA-binding transcriptional regulator YhcF (GntR family)